MSFVGPIIIAELKFCDVQQHALAAPLVGRVDDTAFEDTSEALNGVGASRRGPPVTLGTIVAAVLAASAHPQIQ
jgi:hypothetical protein